MFPVVYLSSLFLSDSAKQKISDEKAIKRAEQEMEKIEEQMEASVNTLYIGCKFRNGYRGHLLSFSFPGPQCCSSSPPSSKVNQRKVTKGS